LSLRRSLRASLRTIESDGKDDPVFIYYRPGSYVPVFRLRELFSERRGIRIAVLPFVDASRSILSGECAQFITDELIHELVRTEGLRVTTASSMGPLVAQALDIPSLAENLTFISCLKGRCARTTISCVFRLGSSTQTGFTSCRNGSKRSRIRKAFQSLRENRIGVDQPCRA
jgi:hypothetical protein